MAFCPPRDGNHPSRLPLVGDLAHPLLTSLSFLSKSIEGSPGKISRHQMACHFPSHPMCWLLRCDVSDRCFSPYLGGTHWEVRGSDMPSEPTSSILKSKT